MIENWLIDAWIFFGMDMAMLIAIGVVLARRMKDEEE